MLITVHNTHGINRFQTVKNLYELDCKLMSLQVHRAQLILKYLWLEGYSRLH
jgi:hypothetical protein